MFSAPVRPGTIVTFSGPPAASDDAASAPVAPTGLMQLVLASVASDNFNRADGAVAGANNWLATSEGGPAITANELVGAGPAAGAYRSSEVYGDDQYAQAAVGAVALPSGAYVGVSVRNQDGQNNYSLVYFNSSGTYRLQLYKKVAAAFVLLASATLPGAQPAGSVLQLTAQGSVIAGQIGVPSAALPAIAVLDTTFAAGGSPGVEMFGGGSLDSFVGGDASTPALPAAAASDSFASGANVSTDGQAWAVMAYVAGGIATVDIPIAGGQLSVTHAIASHAGDVRTDAWAVDHASSIEMGATPPDASGFVMATVRNQAGGAAGYIGGLFQNAALQLLRLDSPGGAGASTLLAGAVSLGNDPPNTKYTVVAQGARIALRYNDKEVLAVTDATYAGGTPGVMMYPASTARTWAACDL